MDRRAFFGAFFRRGQQNGMTELVRLTDVTKVYQGGITGALNGVTLSVERGEFTAVMVLHAE